MVETVCGPPVQPNSSPVGMGGSHTRHTCPLVALYCLLEARWCSQTLSPLITNEHTPTSPPTTTTHMEGPSSRDPSIIPHPSSIIHHLPCSVPLPQPGSKMAIDHAVSSRSPRVETQGSHWAVSSTVPPTAALPHLVPGQERDILTHTLLSLIR